MPQRTSSSSTTTASWCSAPTRTPGRCTPGATTRPSAAAAPAPPWPRTPDPAAHALHARRPPLLRPGPRLAPVHVDDRPDAGAPGDRRVRRAHVRHRSPAARGRPRGPRARAASGTRLTLDDAPERVDGMSSWWAALHGYRHPRLDAALRAQVGEFPHVMFGGLTHGPAV